MELDVFVGNTTIIDEEAYQLWLDGYSGESVIWQASILRVCFLVFEDIAYIFANIF